MPQSYAPCQYTDAVGIQCDVFFPVDESSPQKLCPIHSGNQDALISSENLALTDETKQRYIDIYNMETVFVKDMDLNQIEIHILNLEAVMAKLRARFTASRARKISLIEKLSDAERVERRKIKIVRPESQKTRVSFKKDPVEALAQTLMKTGNLDHDTAVKQAKAILE